MDIEIATDHGATLVVLRGELDSRTSAQVQDQVLPLAEAGSRILIDMAGVSFMSSAGLRLMLTLHRQVAGNGGRVALASLPDDIRDTMNATGFLNFFAVGADREAGWQLLEKG